MISLFLLFFFLFHFICVFKDKLKSENSKVLDNWPSLIEKLQSERDLARENAEYLSTLQEYFVVSICETNFSYYFPSICDIEKITEKLFARIRKNFLDNNQS